MSSGLGMQLYPSPIETLTIECILGSIQIRDESCKTLGTAISTATDPDGVPKD